MQWSVLKPSAVEHMLSLPICFSFSTWLGLALMPNNTKTDAKGVGELEQEALGTGTKVNIEGGETEKTDCREPIEANERERERYGQEQLAQVCSQIVSFFLFCVSLNFAFC